MAIAEASPLDWQQALSRSSDDFDRLIRPIASNLLRGRFEIVESVTASPVAKALDAQAGIDLWFVHTTSGIRGIANRVQRGEKNWRTFTVRKSRESGAVTEYEKRTRAIEREWLYPILTLQGYVTPDGERLLGFAVAKTKDILTIIRNGQAETSRTRADCNIGLASFYVVKWDDITKAGRPLVEYPHR